MTDKTKEIEQASAFEVDLDYKGLCNKYISKKLYSINNNEFTVNHTFNIEPDRFANNDKSTKLLNEATEIIKRCEILKNTREAISYQLAKYLKGLPENERQDILDGKNVRVSQDLRENISLLLTINSEIHRLTLQANGLLNEKVIIDDRIREKLMAAKAVLLYLIEGNQVYDINNQIINEHEIMHWLFMMGEDI